MDNVELRDRLTDLRNGVYAIMSMGLALETASDPGDIFTKGLFYLAEHLGDSIDALKNELVQEKDNPNGDT